ncbi:MAG: regulator of sigma E protease [Chlamydiales bacterium]
MDSLIEQIWRIFQVVFGIGLVIFVHEAGHFIAARLCRVRVEIFSLGFGPRLFGWRRGATTYQVAVVPLGGFVKMAGEEIGEEGSRPADLQYGGDLRSKSVGQRFFIYSGGVLMNVVFGLVVFPLVFFAGVPVISPVVTTLEGTPAWHAGIQDGSRIVAINGKPVFDFLHIPTEVALSGRGPIVLELMEPGASETRTVKLKAEYSEARGLYQVGILPARDLAGKLVVEDGSPAADSGLMNDDVLISVAGVSDELPAREQLGYAMRARGPIDLVVERAGQRHEIHVTPGFENIDGGARKIGVEPIANLVKDMRPNATLKQLDLREDDRLIVVNGRRIERFGDLFDAILAADGELTMRVERDGSQLELSAPAVDEAAAVALLRDLYIAQDQASNQIVVRSGSAAEAAGIQNGDRIIDIDGTRVEEWDEIPVLVHAPAGSTAGLAVSVLRIGPDGESAVLETQVEPRPFEVVHYGFDLPLERSIYQIDNVGEAIAAGSTASWRFLVDTWMTLKGIASREVSASNIGGIITIAAVSHSWASEGWAKLFFFLCLLSMNLAFLNVLPIPVLDGGHLFFLIVEKLKGSPVSERTLGYSQVVGLVMIVSLMVYVTYNDVVRWFMT